MASSVSRNRSVSGAQEPAALPGLGAIPTEPTSTPGALACQPASLPRSGEPVLPLGQDDEVTPRDKNWSRPSDPLALRAWAQGPEPLERTGARPYAGLNVDRNNFVPR